MKIRFILFIAFRYLKAKKKSKTIAASMLLIACISLGIMALTVVIGIMNGFQLSFIEPILNVGSYHIQVSGGLISPRQLQQIRNLKPVTAVVPFCEYDGIINKSKAILIRALPLDVMQLDPAFKESFYLKDNRTGHTFALPEAELLSQPGGILLGNLLGNEMLLRPGDEVPVITFSGNMVVTLKPVGTFKTGYAVIDQGWGFISMETAELFHSSGQSQDLKYGIKLNQRFNDTPALAAISGILGDGFSVKSWRVFNQKFFSALLTEKIMMMIIIGLIFIIVGFGIFYSLRRTVHEKIEEIALLKALGTSSAAIKNIFIAEGFLIGVLGVITGTILGLLVAYNVNEIFRLTEKIANGFLIPLAGNLAALFAVNLRLAPVSIFSPYDYYIDAVPVRVILQEAVSANIFVILCCVIAAYFASRKIAGFKPAVVLRYE